MSKYLKLFNIHAGYEEYINTGEIFLPNVSLCKQENEVHYNPYVYDPSQDYFTMVITTGGGDVTWTGTSSNALSYSTDNGTTWTTPSSNITLSVNVGDKVLWKGTPTPQPDEGIGKFSGGTDVRYSVEGNIMSLLFGDNFKGQTSLGSKNYAFYELFRDNKNITSAENLSLPATTLATDCYGGMFVACTSLTSAPKLPATTLAAYCYENMFYLCTSLTVAPELPATTLANYCYREMFLQCTSLNSIKCLATNISANNCTKDWVSGVAGSGTFTKAASMAGWTKDESGIPSGWAVVNA